MNNELYHYGRLGMKWGKHIYGRKNRKSIGERAAIKQTKRANKILRRLANASVKTNNTSSINKKIGDWAVRHHLDTLNNSKIARKMYGITATNITPKSKFLPSKTRKALKDNKVMELDWETHKNAYNRDGLFRHSLCFSKNQDLRKIKYKDLTDYQLFVYNTNAYNRDVITPKPQAFHTAGEGWSIRVI